MKTLSAPDLTTISCDHNTARMQLIKGGYRVTRPSSTTYTVVALMTCSHCGHVGEMFAESWRSGREPVITLATCRVCGWAEAR